MAEKSNKRSYPKIRLSPELEQKLYSVPGMNTSTNFRQEGVRRLEQLERDRQLKEELIASRMEMKPVLKRRTTRAEKIRGKKDEYEQLINTLAGVMSPVDPVAEFFMFGPAMKGATALGKTVLWNTAKYAPKSQLGNWGRSYFINNAFKNSFNKSSEVVKASPRVYPDLNGSPIDLNEVYSYALDNHVPYKYRLSKQPLSDIEQKSLDSLNFVYKLDASIGEFNKAFGQEILDRLKDLKYDVNYPIVINDKGVNTIRTAKGYVNDAIKKPVRLGYFKDDSGALGMYFPKTDLAVVDVIDNFNIPQVMLHEGVSHRTDNLLEALDQQAGGPAVSLYRDFINKLIYTPEGKLTPGTRKMSPYSKNWWELRATVLENKRKLLMALRQKYPELKGKPLSEYRNPYIKMVDDMSDNNLGKLLEGTNRYGYDYYHLKDNNPFFYRDYRNLLKYGAGLSAPIILSKP